MDKKHDYWFLDIGGGVSHLLIQIIQLGHFSTEEQIKDLGYPNSKESLNT